MYDFVSEDDRELLNETGLDEDADVWGPWSLDPQPPRRFLLSVDGDPDVLFSGTLIGVGQSVSHKVKKNREGVELHRWSEAYLFRTNGGKYFCHIRGMSDYFGETTRYRGKVCNDIEEVKEYMGQSALAKSLYISAGISNVFKID